MPATTRTTHVEARITPAALAVIRLSVEDQHRFARALVNPPAPSSALKSAAQAQEIDCTLAVSGWFRI